MGNKNKLSCVGRAVGSYKFVINVHENFFERFFGCARFFSKIHMSV